MKNYRWILTLIMLLAAVTQTTRAQHKMNIYASFTKLSPQNILKVEKGTSLAGFGFTYKKLTRRTRGIIPKQKGSPLKKVRQQTITGTVSDAQTGKTMPGVNIRVKGTKTGTSTDGQGQYKLSVESLQDTLVFSFVGYQTRQVPISGRKEIDVSLKTQAITGQEMVVVGYGQEQKRNLTGAVSQISSDEVFKNVSVSNTTKMLQGQLPGVYIGAPSGNPTDNFSPVVRGKGSIGAGGRALVLIDGVPGNMNDVNPHDIKNITVQKDASSAAIYGSRAAFGVIQITTKSSKSGKMEVHYSSLYSLNDRTIKPHLLTDGYLWAKNYDESYYNYIGTHPTGIHHALDFSQEVLKELKKRHNDPSLPKVDVDPSTGKYIYYGSSNYQKLLYTDFDPSMDQSLSVSGGSKDANFYLSGRYHKQHGIYRGGHSDKYKVYNFRGKGSLQVFPWLKVSNNFAYTRRHYFQPRTHYSSPVYGLNANILSRIGNEFSPVAVLRNPDGSFTNNAAQTLASYYTGNNYQKYTWQQLRNTSSLDATFFDSRLSVHGAFTYKYLPYLKEEERYPVTYSDAPGHFTEFQPENNWAAQTTHRTDQLRADIYADYKQSFGKHNFKVKIGYEYENKDRTDRYYQRYGLLNPELVNPSLISGENYSLTGGGYEWTTSGGFFRLNYNYAERYLVKVNGRYDGSSKFPMGQQFGFFPSVSAGWRLSNEPYWKVPSGIVSDLKIRGSFGTLGNGSVSPYSFLQTMSVTKSGRLVEGKRPNMTHRPNVIPKELTWERVTTADIGLDVGFLDNRLELTFDKFTRYTTGMFTQGLPLPAVFGAAVPKGNYADMKTPGWEVSLIMQNHAKSAHALQYRIRLSLSDNHSIVTKFNNPQGLIFSYYKGKQLGEIWGLETDGLYQSEEQIKNEASDQSRFPPTTRKRDDLQPGDIKFVDQNGDGKITSGNETLDDHGDYEVIGNKQPRYLFGINGNMEWHHFSLSFFLQGVGKQDWWPASDATMFWGQYGRPYGIEPISVYKDAWRSDNKDGYFPRVLGYTALHTRNEALNTPSSRYLQNVAYIRLKSLTIGYNLPESFISKVGLKDAEVFLSGQNLWIWSPLFNVTRAIDPESIYSQSAKNTYVHDSYVNEASRQNETDVYPKLRTISFGLNLTF